MRYATSPRRRSRLAGCTASCGIRQGRRGSTRPAMASRSRWAGSTPLAPRRRSAVGSAGRAGRAGGCRGGRHASRPLACSAVYGGHGGGRWRAAPICVRDRFYLQKMLLNELSDGMEVDQVLLVREAERRRAARRRRLPAPAARRPHGRGRGMVWDELPRSRSSACAGLAGARARPLRRAPALRPADQSARHRAGRAGNLLDPTTCSTARARARRADGAASCASWSPRCRSPHLRALLERVFGEDSRAVAGLPRARRPPSTTTRPTATACSSTRLGVAQARQRDQRDVPGHRPRRRGHGRAAARHRQARGLHRRAAAHRPDRRRAACRARSRSATTASAARSRRIEGFPPRARAGGRAHHPLPPRHAGARQPGRARARARRRSCT